VVLLVDDEPGVHEAVIRHLERPGLARLEHAYNVFQANDVLARTPIDLILLDLDLPGERGETLLDRVQPDIRGGRFEVVMLTSDGGVPSAVRCARLGALDYLTKTAEAYASLGKTLEAAMASRRHRRAAATHVWHDETQALVLNLTRSRVPAARTLTARLNELAASPGPVLIEARPGQKAAHLAHYLHSRSQPSEALFVALDARASSSDSTLKTLERPQAPVERLAAWALSDSGTLFIENIDQLDHSGRGVLEHLLNENGTARVVVAVAPGQATGLGHDAWRRLRDRRVTAVPLSERRADVPLLVELWRERQVSPAPRFSADAIAALQEYHWPRDLEELEELLAGLALHLGAEQVELADLPLPVIAPLLARRAAARSSYGQVYERSMKLLERELFRHVLARHHGDQRLAAAELGISLALFRRQLGEP
jgi:DNA-binding NtrC family response regulator